jgi:hypothetical protein
MGDTFNNIKKSVIAGRDGHLYINSKGSKKEKNSTERNEAGPQLKETLLSKIGITFTIIGSIATIVAFIWPFVISYLNSLGF